MYLKSINPASGYVIREYLEYQWDEVDEIITNSAEAFTSWRHQPIAFRMSLLRNLVTVLEEKKEGLAFTISIEMGKLVWESRAEIEKCIALCNYYLENGEEFLQSEDVQTEATHSYISYRPLGPILAIMPWNFPFWQVFRCAIPAIMAGNTVILKHASNVPACSVALGELFVEAGFPRFVFFSLLVNSRRIEKILSDKRIAGVALTGSVSAGKAVAQVAGQHLKKCILELGGSDPYIILPDADLENAVDCCVKSRLLNTGQSCIGAKRFIIHKEVYNKFEEMFVERMRSVSYGDPFNEENIIGPMARSSIREDLQRQVTRSIAKGATLLCGGEMDDGVGYYFPATVLANVKSGMPAYDEELFGPVASLIKVKNEAEAIFIANDTSFGLGAGIFTADISRAKYLAEEELDAGCCFINDFVRSDPRLPFGGVKDSGFGRELSYFGIREFVNVKTIYQK